MQVNVPKSALPAKGTRSTVSGTGSGNSVPGTGSGTTAPWIGDLLDRAAALAGPAARAGGPGGSAFTLSGVRGGARPWLVGALAERLSRPVVVVTDGLQVAEELHRDLETYGGAVRPLLFPHWDTIPFDGFSPNKDLISQRFQAILALLDEREGAPAAGTLVLVTTAQAFLQGMLDPAVLTSLRFTLQQGGRYARGVLVQRLIDAGYNRVDLVEAPGEFSVRGEIVDVFPIQEEHPVRLDFFDDELESLRSFEVASQTSFAERDRLDILPASEGVVTPETAARALAELPHLKAQVQPEVYRQAREALEQGRPFPGYEQHLPLFYPKVAWLHQVLPPNTLLVLDQPQRIAQTAQQFFDEVLGEYELCLRQGTLALSPDRFYLPAAQFAGTIQRFGRMNLEELRIEDEPGAAQGPTLVAPVADNAWLRAVAVEKGASAHAALKTVLGQLKTWRDEGAPVLLAARSQTGAERLKQLLAEFELGATLTPAEGGLRPIVQSALERVESGQAQVQDIVLLPRAPQQGFRVVDEGGATRLVLLTEEELLGEKTRQRRLKKSKLQHFIASLGDLKPGDLVVHVEYGIGRYEGLKRLTAGNAEVDVLELAYAGGDKVYVPVYKLNQVQKFTGIDGSGPPLSRLGDGAWQKSKQRAARAVQDMAEELVRLYAARKARQGHAFERDQALVTEFEDAFPFQETEDQMRAIDEVLGDMNGDMPMDRLVCGDVGFGKTEVAMRAAYLAVLGKKQVLVLVPTTILAQQHLETFTRRFENFGVTIDVLSRFRTPLEQRHVLKAFAEGRLDILIGTHRLLSADVVPKDLGLLIIDEEQRFGVAHKEKIKRLKTQVDVVTLSATPIPRTLHMSLMGVRDLSVINTPPMDRMAIRTRLVKSSDYIIREAVERELRRGGQVFFVHNRVEDIHAFGNYLLGVLPRVRLAIAHGQMAERELEEVMLRFVHGEVDVLLTTTIIESGLDIPRANTIIIHHADHFGLAQLYQLRGRVGRSNVQAYAYLLVSGDKLLTEVAQKRLNLLQELNDLGSGFKIASHDLEIRGAGNLLGREQSGHVNTIGLELFTQMVEEAVAQLKGEDALQPPRGEIKLELGFPYLLPERYIESTQQRLDIYKRLAEVKSEDEVWELRQMLEDRYGLLPPEMANLFILIQVRLAAQRYGLAALERAGGQLQARFAHPDRIDIDRLMALLRDPRLKLKLEPEDKLLLGPMPDSAQGVLERLKMLDGVVKQAA